jgi:hypothetical protein
MPPKTGLDALLRPEDSILVLIDHQPYQFANLNSHEPTMIVNNVIGLERWWARRNRAFCPPYTAGCPACAGMTTEIISSTMRRARSSAFRALHSAD